MSLEAIKNNEPSVVWIVVETVGDLVVCHGAYLDYKDAKKELDQFRKFEKNPEVSYEIKIASFRESF